ncbi:hypothetical protein Tel_15475 [Candidatus Tenderia electrophaga]|jgi:hypothetical protein|uniref:Entericidin EcnAB n=1 Tax=Candidatus Tenderia electrophaga TaxID=1748243 RepID=A0A0S2TH40_9GAMM|nr:hypothetical protein Tel_15475 [Candidatus Tenderia electrophaga]
MKKTNQILALTGASLMMLLVACDQQGPAEQAGENIDEAAEAAGESMEQAGENIEDAAGDVADEADETVDDMSN